LSRGSRSAYTYQPISSATKGEKVLGMTIDS
jgi:hypothetical protein